MIDNSIIGKEALEPSYNLIIFCPAIAVACRRMQDVGKSGWLMLIPIYNIYLWCQPSEPKINQYGNIPK